MIIMPPQDSHFQHCGSVIHFYGLVQQTNYYLTMRRLTSEVGGLFIVYEATVDSFSPCSELACQILGEFKDSYLLPSLIIDYF